MIRVGQKLPERDITWTTRREKKKTPGQRRVRLLAEAKKQSKALCYGNFYSVVLTNGQCVFGRECDGEKVFVCINAADQSFFAGFDMGKGDATDLITGEQVTLNGGLELPPYSAYFLR